MLKPKRFRITKMTLDEISGVDKPAQPGALVALMKRAPTDPADPGPEEITMFKTRAELEAAIAKFLKDGGTDETITTIRKSATDLKAEDVLPATGALAKVAADPRVAALEARLEKADKLGAMPAEVRAHYDALPAAEQDTFLTKSLDNQKAVVEKANAKDPVVYTTLSGVPIHKSAGDTVLMLAKQNDDLSKRLATSEATARDATLTKRAEDELKHTPGTVEVRKALLKSVDSITDEGTRAEALKALHAADAALAKAFKTNGSSGGGNPDGGTPDDKLDDLAKAYAKEHKVEFAKAYSAVLDTEEGAALYAESIGQPA